MRGPGGANAKFDPSKKFDSKSAFNNKGNRIIFQINHPIHD